MDELHDHDDDDYCDWCGDTKLGTASLLQEVVGTMEERLGRSVEEDDLKAMAAELLALIPPSDL